MPHYAELQRSSEGRFVSLAEVDPPDVRAVRIRLCFERLDTRDLGDRRPRPRPPTACPITRG